MFSSRAAPSIFNRHDAVQSTNKIFRRWTNSPSKNHKRKPRGVPRPENVRIEKRLDREYRMSMSLIKREELIHIKTARANRREDWELGPLKPWREAALATVPLYIDPSKSAGEKDSSDAVAAPDTRYGSVSSASRDRYPIVPKHRRIKDWFLRIGDRVCLVEGRDGERGKIGTVEAIDIYTERVTVKGVNVVDIRRPPHLVSEGEPPIDTVEMPIPFRSLRLVYPIADPDTGEYRDCIINHLEKRNRRRDPFRAFDDANQWVFDRYLMPQNVKIPWPEEQEKVGEDSQDDTPRMEVEEKSFMPTLLRPPMPEGVLDQLRKDDKEFDGRMKLFDLEHLDKTIEEQAKTAQVKDIKEMLAVRGARNVARGGRTANGEFMRSKELPEFDPQTLQVIAGHVEAARSKKANAVPTASVSSAEEPRAPA